MVGICVILPHTVRPRKRFFTALGNCVFNMSASEHSICSQTIYSSRMPSNDIKETLWANVSALMRYHFGKENLSELARRAQIGLASCDRIKKRDTSVGIDVLASVAAVFELQAWHLLTPNLDPANPPVIWMTTTEFDFYEKLKQTALSLAAIQH